MIYFEVVRDRDQKNKDKKKKTKKTLKNRAFISWKFPVQKPGIAVSCNIQYILRISFQMINRFCDILACDIWGASIWYLQQYFRSISSPSNSNFHIFWNCWPSNFFKQVDDDNWISVTKISDNWSQTWSKVTETLIWLSTGNFSDHYLLFLLFSSQLLQCNRLFFTIEIEFSPAEITFTAKLN